MNERLKLIRQTLQLTQKEFGARIGYTSSISELEKGTAIITDRLIISICAIYHVNEKWFRTRKWRNV